MALVLKDRVQETTTTSGTGTLTLSGAVAGFQTFSTAIGNGNTTYYTIYDNTAYVWEVGIGTVGAGTLARTTVLSNSSGGTSPINLAGNTAFVFCTYPAERSINYDADDVATIGSTLGYTDTGIIASFASTVAGYNQVILQNKSTATNASTNFNVSNDAGTAGTNYAELGINSSTFTGSGSFNIAGASYVASASTDLTLGTYGAYSIHFVTNSSTTDAMTIFNNGGISLGGFSNPGIGNMAASKFVPGYSSVTAAAGTTVLTASSNYYQNLVGTTTQTFQLPDATGLLEGTTFIFDNDSTGTLTVVDNASGPIETVPAGAASFVYLADNATVAGTWRRHAFLPASYDFNSTTANFGNATITNAVWNGTTIASGYGGTGLTTFTAANNALYSTSASALVAGTLPIAAGGTAKTTFTTNGVVYGDGTNPLGVTAAGTTGQVLVATTGSAPSWGAIPSTAAVTSFQTSLSGLTPSTATTGAVTLAGTLGVANGGTGTSTAFTAGSVLFAGASGVYSQDNAFFFWDNTNDRLGINTNSPTTALDVIGTIKAKFTSLGDAVTLEGRPGGTGSFKVALTPTTLTAIRTIKLPDADIDFTTGLPVANGGTGQTTYTDGQLLIGNTTGNTLTKATLTQGTGITITNGSGAITVANAGVTSFSAGTTGLTPNTGTTGAVTLAGTLGVSNGGTGQTTYTDGQLLIGNSTGNTLTKATLTAGSGISITNGSGSITIANTGAGATISNDTSTASYVYPTFAAATTGSLSTIYTSNAKLLYKPSTGDFQSTTLTANGCFFLNPQTLPASYTVAASYSASSVGPITIPSGMSVTVSSGARWVVL